MVHIETYNNKTVQTVKRQTININEVENFFKNYNVVNVVFFNRSSRFKIVTNSNYNFMVKGTFKQFNKLKDLFIKLNNGNDIIMDYY